MSDLYSPESDGSRERANAEDLTHRVEEIELQITALWEAIQAHAKWADHQTDPYEGLPA